MRVAVTGGIAEGKSTVLRYLSELGQPVQSSDELARQVYSDSYTQSTIASLLGVSEPVARDVVLEAMTKRPGFRRALNALMHQRIASLIELSIAGFIEVPLLAETCMMSRFDRVWVVTCGPDEQLRRLVERVGSADAARALIAAQLSTEVKCAFADEVIRTNANSRNVQRSVAAALHTELGGFAT